ncbi:GntR family transcriptional regulator [Ruegeria sediminis]|uniref:GntR family transcriptional regulator n=1 Tax=Ruegeria sediminis TaxID=2583820 RepID=A0ABY2X3H1_9RHOB|nr:GntR family transcriptional regulator [Ruegeria sediminis]TMV09936.1 GntR family transcriptional regulator [Ruegeria sediminis]
MPENPQPNDYAIQRMTLADKVANRLRDWILTGTLPPGQPLVESELAALLDVSRTPTREALRVLATEGLIEMQPNRRPKVADPTLEDLLALLDVHIELEALGSRMAAQRITAEELDALQALQKEMENFPEDGDPLDFFRLDMELHQRIMQASGNAPLCATHEQYNGRLFRARFLSTHLKPRRAALLGQHGAVLDALRDGDGERASAIMREHLEQLKANTTAIAAERASGGA